MAKSLAWSMLAHGLREAAANRNWEAVARLDRQIADIQREAGALLSLTAAERSSLADIRSAHREAQACCTDEIAAVGQKLEELRGCLDGWRAYAANGDIEEFNQ